MFLGACSWKKIIVCVCVCTYIKNDSYWEGSEAPCHCSHIPKPLATLMSLPYPCLTKCEGKKKGKKKKS